jgi:hypothetical protein
VPVWSEELVSVVNGGGAVLCSHRKCASKRVLGTVCFLARSLIGLLLSGTFLILTDTMTADAFLDYGWRIPFIAVRYWLLARFLYRFKITKRLRSKTQKEREDVKVPFSTLLKFYKNQLILALLQLLPLSWFYLMTGLH